MTTIAQGRGAEGPAGALGGPEARLHQEGQRKYAGYMLYEAHRHLITPPSLSLLTVHFLL